MPNEMKYTGDHNEICQIRKFCRSRATLDSVLQNGAVNKRTVSAYVNKKQILRK